MTSHGHELLGKVIVILSGVEPMNAIDIGMCVGHTPEPTYTLQRADGSKVSRMQSLVREATPEEGWAYLRNLTEPNVEPVDDATERAVLADYLTKPDDAV